MTGKVVKLRAHKRAARTWTFALAVGLLFLALVPLLLFGCASESRELVTAHTELHTTQQAPPWVFSRELHGQMEWFRPDGGVRARAVVTDEERDASDGGVTATEDQGLDLRAWKDHKTKPAIPLLGIAGSVFGLALLGYALFRWRSVLLSIAARAFQALSGSPGKPPTPGPPA